MRVHRLLQVPLLHMQVDGRAISPSATAYFPHLSPGWYCNDITVSSGRVKCLTSQFREQRLYPAVHLIDICPTPSVDTKGCVNVVESPMNRRPANDKRQPRPGNTDTTVQQAISALIGKLSANSEDSPALALFRGLCAKRSKLAVPDFDEDTIANEQIVLAIGRGDCHQVGVFHLPPVRAGVIRPE